MYRHRNCPEVDHYVHVTISKLSMVVLYRGTNSPVHYRSETLLNKIQAQTFFRLVLAGQIAEEVAAFDLTLLGRDVV